MVGAGLAGHARGHSAAALTQSIRKSVSAVIPWLLYRYMCLGSPATTKAWWEGEGGICKGRSGALPYPAPMLGVDAAALVEALAAVLAAALVALAT